RIAEHGADRAAGMRRKGSGAAVRSARAIAARGRAGIVQSLHRPARAAESDPRTDRPIARTSEHFSAGARIQSRAPDDHARPAGTHPPGTTPASGLSGMG